MKRLFFILSTFLSFSAFAQTPTNLLELKAAINSWLVTNGNKQITAVQLNQLFNATANLMNVNGVDSARLSNDTLYLLRRGGVPAIAVKLPGLSASETDPTIPLVVKQITAENISSWNAKASPFTTDGTSTFFEGSILKSKNIGNSDLTLLGHRTITGANKALLINSVGQFGLSSNGDLSMSGLGGLLRTNNNRTAFEYYSDGAVLRGSKIELRAVDSVFLNTPKFILPHLKNNISGDSILTTNENGEIIQILKPSGGGGGGGATDTFHLRSDINWLMANKVGKPDTTLPQGFTTLYRHLKARDSLAALIGLRLLATDSSAMLAIYLRSVGYGLIKSGQTVLADTTKLGTLWRVNRNREITDSAITALDNRTAILEDKNNFYADALAGNDLNDGRSINRPVRTIARLLSLSIQPYDVIWLARGSVWYEFLNLSSYSHIEVRSYGIGPKPVLDCADVAANNLFSKTSGQTNVYQISWTNQFRDNTDVSQYSVWENGYRLLRVSSLSACNSTPGSYYAPTVTQSGGTNTIQVHSRNSDSIPVNGRTYEITRRPMGAHLGDNCSIYDIHTRRNGSNDGSFKSGHNSYVYGVITEDGVKHNFFMMSGKAENCMAWKNDVPPGVGSATLFVSFTTSNRADTMDVLYKNCIVMAGTNDNGQLSVGAIGYYMHTGGATQYRSTTVDGGYIYGVSGGIDGEARHIVSRGVYFDNVTTAIGKTGAGTIKAYDNISTGTLVGGSSRLDSIIVIGNKTSGTTLLNTNAKVVVVKNNTMFSSTAGTGDINLIRKIQTDSITVYVSKNIISRTGTGATFILNSVAIKDSITLVADSNYAKSFYYYFNTNVSPTLRTLAQMKSMYNVELRSQTGIQPPRVGNLNTADYFLLKSDSLYGKAGSANSYDSIYRYPFQYFAGEGKPKIDLPDNEAVKNLNTHNLMVYQDFIPLNLDSTADASGGFLYRDFTTKKVKLTKVPVSMSEIVSSPVFTEAVVDAINLFIDTAAAQLVPMSDTARVNDTTRALTSNAGRRLADSIYLEIELVKDSLRTEMAEIEGGGTTPIYNATGSGDTLTVGQKVKRLVIAATPGITATSTSTSNVQTYTLNLTPAGVQSLTDGSTITWDFAGGTYPNKSVTIAGSRTLAISNVVAGAVGILKIVQGGSGSYELTYPSGSKFPGGTAFDLSNTVGAVDILTFFYDGTNYYWNLTKAYN